MQLSRLHVSKSFFHAELHNFVVFRLVRLIVMKKFITFSQIGAR